MNDEYAKTSEQVLRECEKALHSVSLCRAYDGTTCSPTDTDFEMVFSALDSIVEYFELRGIKLY